MSHFPYASLSLSRSPSLCCCTEFSPLPKHVTTEAPSILLIASTSVSGGALSWSILELAPWGQPLTSHRGHSCSPLITKPCHTNTVQSSFVQAFFLVAFTSCLLHSSPEKVLQTKRCQRIPKEKLILPLCRRCLSDGTGCSG